MELIIDQTINGMQHIDARRKTQANNPGQKNQAINRNTREIVVAFIANPIEKKRKRGVNITGIWINWVEFGYSGISPKRDIPLIGLIKRETETLLARPVGALLRHHVSLSYRPLRYFKAYKKRKNLNPIRRGFGAIVPDSATLLACLFPCSPILGGANRV